MSNVAPSSRAEIAAHEPQQAHSARVGVYAIVGMLFGFVLTKSEAVSWFRIQEMFRLQGFHMYGILMTAIPVAAISIRLLKSRRVRAWSGDEVSLTPKTLGKGVRYVIGGALFGCGWALTGACPGPLFALLGSGLGVIAVVIASALLGTWLYGVLRPHLPH